MKGKIKNFIKRYSGEAMIIIGTKLFIYNVLDFSYKATRGLCPPIVSCENLGGVAYYYSSDVLSTISIGAMLVISGILIIRNKYAKKD